MPLRTARALAKSPFALEKRVGVEVGRGLGPGVRVRVGARAEGAAHLGKEQPREVVLAPLEAGLQLAHLLGLAGQPESQQRKRVLVNLAPAARRELPGLGNLRVQRSRRDHLQRREEEERG